MTNDLTPGHLNSATFRTVRKGYDPAEVDALLRDAAASLERAQQHAAAMEARARAAVARLHEQPESTRTAPEPAAARLSSDDADRISRTLLLAQETADRAIAEANEAAQQLLDQARAEAGTTLESAHDESATILDQARAEARRASETERLAAVDEVERLKARREFLLGDVDQLEAFLVDQRDRLRTAAHEIESLAERVPGGLGTLSPPPMSASDDEPVADDEPEAPDAADDAADDAETTEPVAERPGADEAAADEVAAAGDDEALDAEPESDDAPGTDEPTHAPFPGFVSDHDDEAEVVLPPETQMPFADASKLAEALGASDVLDDAPATDDGGGVFDTSELDVTQVMDALDRRVRGESVPRRDDDDATGELPIRKRPSD